MHVDADNTDYQSRLDTHFRPARTAMDEGGQKGHLLPLVPVRMMEAWILADKPLLKSEIGTTLPDSTLGLARDPESMADPKQAIIEAIRIAGEHDRRIDVEISDLYSIIGDKIQLEELRRLASFRQFETDLRYIFQAFNLLH